jgi:hypothetical protein
LLLALGGSAALVHVAGRRPQRSIGQAPRLVEHVGAPVMATLAFEQVRLRFGERRARDAQHVGGVRRPPSRERFCNLRGRLGGGPADLILQIEIARAAATRRHVVHHVGQLRRELPADEIFTV